MNDVFWYFLFCFLPCFLNSGSWPPVLILLPIWVLNHSWENSSRMICQFHLLIKSGLSKKSSYLAWFHFLQYPIRLTTITVNEGPTEKSDFMTLSTFVFDLTWRRGIQWGCCSGVRWDLRCSKPNDLLKAEEGHVEEPPRLALGWGQGRAFERKWCPLMKKEEQLHSWKRGESALDRGT